MNRIILLNSMAFMLVVVVSLPLSSWGASTKHVPLIVPLSVHKIGHFLGIGYSGQNLYDTADVTVLGFVGDVKGISIDTAEINLNNWLTLGAQLQTTRFATYTNYSRQGKESLFRSLLNTSRYATSLRIDPWSELPYLHMVVGGHTVSFDSFDNDDGRAIDLPGLHITDLKQTFLQTAVGFVYTIDAGETAYSGTFFSGEFGAVTLGKSAGYSASMILNYNIEGQFRLVPNSFVFVQYFQSDASATEKAITRREDVDNALNIDCSASRTASDCTAFSQSASNFITAHNNHGTAQPLGGPERMKAYPINYLRAAHSQYMTIEWRLENIGAIDDFEMFFHAFIEAARVADSNLASAKTLTSSGFDLGFHLDEEYAYKFVLATGELGWAANLSLARSW